ncbi:hypothetical protein CRE_18288 [Caenorhabditis remanei]|uniref:Galectin n=1 Tax=Caenorhabditis remanei TaxID=31234 RepID=E3NL98_CAERE|nr:hypothetical protein CRE_18288 [Caenorhabditis remanei]
MKLLLVLIFVLFSVSTVAVSINALATGFTGLASILDTAVRSSESRSVPSSRIESVHGKVVHSVGIKPLAVGDVLEIVIYAKQSFKIFIHSDNEFFVPIALIVNHWKKELSITSPKFEDFDYDEKRRIPFVLPSQLLINFEVLKIGWKVTINNDWVMIYEKRMSLAFAHTLSIFGDVMVQTVQLYQYSGLEENEAEYGSYEE